MMDKRSQSAWNQGADKGSKGFVLFEVLVSSAILATACLLLARSLTESVKAVYTSQDYYTAAITVENVLWDLDHADRYVPKSHIEGMDNFRNNELQIDEETVCSGYLDRIKVVFNWSPASNRKESVTLSTYH